MSINQLLICDKSKLYFEFSIIVTKREIKMNKSTDMEPKSLVGGIYPPLDPPIGGFGVKTVIILIKIPNFVHQLFISITFPGP